MLQHLLIAQPGPFVSLCMFHVAIAELSEDRFHRAFVSPAENLRFSQRKQCFSIPFYGTVRRLLHPFMVLVVVVDPPNATSAVDSHLRLLFYPFLFSQSVARRLRCESPVL